MPSAISWSVASQSLSSSGASQPASRKRLGTIRPWSPWPPSFYGCDKCPQDLAASPIRCHALLGDPQPLGQSAGLPEHVDRDAASRIPIAADAQEFRLD